MIAEHGREVGAVAVPAVAVRALAGCTPAAPAPPMLAALVHAVDQRGEHVELLRVGVLGRSYLREIGRKTSVATWWAWLDQRLELLRYLEVDHGFLRSRRGRAPSMTPAARRSRYQRSTGCSLTKPWPPSSCTPSEPISMPFVRAEPAGDGRLAGEVLAAVGAARGAVGRQAHALELDADVGDGEGDRLAVGDRLAEGLALVDVGDHVVEDGLRGADAPARTRRSGARLDALGVDLGASPSPSSALGRRARRPSSMSRPVAAARRPIAGSGSIEQPGRRRTRRRTAPGPMPSSVGGDDEQLGSRRRAATSDLTPSSTQPSPSRRAFVCSSNGSKSGRGSRIASAAARDVLAGEGGQVGGLLLGRRPRGRSRWRRPPGASAAKAMPMSPWASASPIRHGGHRRPLVDRAAELLGHAEHR